MTSSAFKKRLVALSLIVFALPLSIGLFIIGYVEIKEMLEYRDLITYSWGYVLLIMLPLFFALIFTLAIYSLVTGEQAPLIVQKKVANGLSIFCILALLSTLLFSYYYKNTLIDKKYILCPGIPSGWMPGMADKYAKDESLCKKRGV